MRKAGEEEYWKKKTNERGGWKRLSDEAVKKLRAAPHPWKRGRESVDKMSLLKISIIVGVVCPV